MESQNSIFCLNENFSTTQRVSKEKPALNNKPEDYFESIIFLPKNSDRQDEGGLRTKGYFKKNLKLEPLVTIITVVFNGEEFIKEAINSVLSQTYSNIEYIIIDGGSTDQTIEIIKQYEPYIDYWVSEKDKGIYDAMNKGIRLATGEIIGILNSDDLYELDAIQNSVKYFIRENADFTYGKAYIINRDGQREGIQNPVPKDELKFRTQEALFPHVSLFIKQESYKHKVGLFDTKYKISSDVELMLRINKKCQGVNTEKIIGNFRRGGTSGDGRALLEMRQIAINYGKSLLMSYLKYYISLLKISLSNKIPNYFLFKIKKISKSKWQLLKNNLIMNNNSEIKIMILINQLGYGGAVKIVFDFINSFNQNEKEYSIVSIGMWGGERYTYKDFEKLGIDVVDFGGRSKFDTVALIRLYKYLKNNKIDILHTHLPHSHIVGRIAGRLARVPKIVSTLQNVYQSQNAISSLVDYWTIGLSDVVTAVSRGTEESYFGDSQLFTIEALEKGRTHFTIYNGVDVAKIDKSLGEVNKKEKLESLNLNQNNLNIVCAARLHPNKGHTYLLNAIAQIKNSSPKLHFLFLGDGPLENMLKEQADKLSVQEYITFLGYRKDVYEIFAVVDAFILPSINEGLPVSVAEAMAVSLPVIATEIPGVKEIVEQNVTGWLVPPADVQSLAEVLKESTVNSEQLKVFSKNGRERIEEKFSINSITEQYKSIYKYLAQKK